MGHAEGLTERTKGYEVISFNSLVGAQTGSPSRLQTSVVRSALMVSAVLMLLFVLSLPFPPGRAHTWVWVWEF